MTFKIKIFQVLTKVNPNNENETEARNFSWDIFKSNALFLSKHMKVFQWHSKSNFSVLWLKWKQAKCKWNKTRHFAIGRIQIWHHNFLYQKNIKIFQWLSQSKLLSFMMKVSPSNGNETISHIFSRDIQIWHHIFLYQKLLKYFNDFQNQNFSVLWLKWTQSI